MAAWQGAWQIHDTQADYAHVATSIGINPYSPIMHLSSELVRTVGSVIESSRVEDRRPPLSPLLEPRRGEWHGPRLGRGANVIVS